MKTYTVNEAAIYLGVSPVTVRRYIKDSMLPAEKKPKGLKYEYVIYENYLDNFKNQADDESIPDWLIENMREQIKQWKAGTLKTFTREEVEKNAMEALEKHRAEKRKKKELEAVEL